MSTEPRLEQFGGLTYTEWAAMHDAKREAEYRANLKGEAAGAFIYGMLQLAFLGGLLWGFVALVKFMWIHS